ncbi:putative ribonuclease H-like domain-containing protein, partial [Tanacetum coccineum]
KTGRKIIINGSDTAGYEKSKVECFNCHKIGHFVRECRGPKNQDSRNRNQHSSRRTINVEETSSKTMMAIDGAGFDWSYVTDDEVPTNMALMAFSDSKVHNDKTCSKTYLKSFETLKTQLDDLIIEFNKSEFNLATYKRGLASVEEQLVFYKKNEVIFCEQLAVLKRDISYKDPEISMLKNELEMPKQEKESNQLKIKNFDNASKSLDKLIGSQIPDKSRKGVGFVSYNAVPPPPTRLFSPPNLDLSYYGLEEFQQPEFEGYGPKPSKSFSEDTFNEVRESPDALVVEELVSNDKLEKKTIFLIVAKMEFVRPKQQENPVRKPVKLTAITIKGKGWPKAVNTTRPNSTVVNAVRANQVNAVKASACFVWRPTILNSASITLKKHNYVDGHPQKEDQGYVDSGCLRHMTGNMSYLSAMSSLRIKEIDRDISRQDYILMPLWKDGSLFDSSLKNASNDEPQPSSDAGKKDDEGVNKESGIDDQERPKNSTQDVNTAGPSINTASTNVNTGSLNINIVSPTVTTAPLEATHADFFGDETEVDMSNITTTYPVPSTPNTRIHKDHSLDHVIGDVQSGVLTRRMTKTTNKQGFISAVYEGKTHEDLHTFLLTCFLSQEKPKKVIQALKDPSWIEAMQEELLQFKLQQVWTLVDLPHGKRAIGTKWVYMNKKDERCIKIRNKARLFLAYASFKDFVVYQIDVKSAFLYSKIEEEVYVCQPLGFEDPEFPDKIGQIDKTMFIKRVKSDILLIQVYVDDIIFRSTKKELCTEFEKLMHKKFKMSSIGELTFFLRLQVTQKDDGIFISQDKYMDDILKKFGFSTVKTASTPMETSKPLMKDENAKDLDVHLYRLMIGSLMYLTSSRPDIMFAVCACVRFQVTPKVSHLHVVKRIFRYLKGQPKLGLWKSTIGGCQFLGCRLISWQCKKQTVLTNSTTEAEYVLTTSCCGQTKHIEIRHHFIRDSNEKKLIQMIKIHTDQNVTELLTKAFDVRRFQYLIASIGMLNL